MTIAVDFDGTLTTMNGFPNVGAVRENAFPVLKWLQSKGHCLVMWTCRYGAPLCDAIKVCEDRGFKFDYVNCGPFTTGSSKIVADIYIDDCAYPNVLNEPEKRIDWNIIAKSFNIPEKELEAFRDE